MKTSYNLLRVLKEAEYTINTGSTVRETAKKFKVSKSTVHNDITKRLSRIDKKAASQVREILEDNKAKGRVKGGISTSRMRYASVR